MELLVDVVLFAICAVGALAFVVWLIFNIICGLAWGIVVFVVCVKSRIERARIKRELDIR